MTNSKTTFVTVNLDKQHSPLKLTRYSKTTFVTVNLKFIALAIALAISFKNNLCYC